MVFFALSELIKSQVPYLSMLVLFRFFVRSAEFALFISDNFFLVSSSCDLFSTPYFNNEIVFDFSTLDKFAYFIISSAIF